MAGGGPGCVVLCGSCRVTLRGVRRPPPTCDAQVVSRVGEAVSRPQSRERMPRPLPLRGKRRSQCAHWLRNDRNGLVAAGRNFSGSQAQLAPCLFHRNRFFTIL